MKYLRFVALLLTLAAATPAAWGQSFGAKTDYPTGPLPLGMALGDVNGDGHLDIATANYATNVNTASILLGTGTGSFAPKTDYPTGPNLQCIALGDVNGDGRLDFVTADVDAGMVTVLLGLASGGFGLPSSYPAGPATQSIALGDVNGDHYLDIVTTNMTVHTTSVLLGIASGGFGARTDYATGLTPLDVALGDVNADGRLDIVTANYDANTTSVLLGLAGGGFGNRADYFTGANPLSVALGDVNGDNRLDIVTANNAPTALSTSVLLGVASGGFAPKTDYLSGARPVSVALGDVSGDGRLDMVLANSNASIVSVLVGLASGGFRPGINYATGGGSYTVALGDLNGDNRLDIVTSHYTNNTVSVILNTGTYTPLATVCPTAAEITLVPNPAHDAFVVQLPAGHASGPAELLNSLGQVVRRPTVSGSSSFLVETIGLAPGVYTLRFALGAGTVARRVVVE